MIGKEENELYDQFPFDRTRFYPQPLQNSIVPITICVLEILEDFRAFVDQLGESSPVSDVPLKVL